MDEPQSRPAGPVEGDRDARGSARPGLHWRRFTRSESYRGNIVALLDRLLAPLAPVERALDFGSGDGWFARELQRRGLAREVVAVDVQRRADAHVEPHLYDGRRLPFEDRAFPLTYALDVLHHCPDPRASLRDLLRCTGRYFALKDHTYRTPLGRLTLCLFDELGNRRFGVPSLYHYQRSWTWSPWIAAEGFEPLATLHPAPCHDGLLGQATNHLQFLALWRRAGP
jgi:SAM-dependent methyltransferase